MLGGASAGRSGRSGGKYPDSCHSINSARWNGPCTVPEGSVYNQGASVTGPTGWDGTPPPAPPAPPGDCCCARCCACCCASSMPPPLFVLSLSLSSAPMRSAPFGALPPSVNHDGCVAGLNRASSSAVRRGTAPPPRNPGPSDFTEPADSSDHSGVVSAAAPRGVGAGGAPMPLSPTHSRPARAARAPSTVSSHI